MNAVNVKIVPYHEVCNARSVLYNLACPKVTLGILLQLQIKTCYSQLQCMHAKLTNDMTSLEIPTLAGAALLVLSDVNGNGLGEVWVEVLRLFLCQRVSCDHYRLLAHACDHFIPYRRVVAIPVSVCLD